jgi:hypothetical protein
MPVRIRQSFGFGGMLASAVMAAGCVDMHAIMIEPEAHGPVDPGIVAARDEVGHRIVLARAQGAETCAPDDLAVADANLDFIDVELQNNNPDRARVHVRLASDAADRALSASRRCTAVVRQ